MDHNFRDPPSAYRVDLSNDQTLNLGAWCKTQRRKYKRGLLSKEDIKELNDLKFQWILPRGMRFEVYFEQFLKYRKDHNGANPRSGYILLWL